MATKKTGEMTFQDRLKAWWETDTAKAVATIVAVLLIPASVIAWNYATTQGSDVRNQLNTDSTANIANDSENTEEATPGEETEASANADTQTAADQTPATQSEPAQNTEGQEPATNNNQAANTSTAADTTTDADEPAVGGLGSVEKLPNTDSVEYYTVKNGDTVYRISMNICGNNSFYTSNMRKNYLKVGETLKVNCN